MIVALAHLVGFCHHQVLAKSSEVRRWWPVLRECTGGGDPRTRGCEVEDLVIKFVRIAYV